MWTFLICLLFFVGAVFGQGYYKVISSRTIRPNSLYHCAVSVVATSEPTTVVITIRGTSHNGTVFNVLDTVVVPPYSTRIASLEIRNIENGNYKLEVRGTGGVDFSDFFPLEYLKKSYSVFIQTDRAVYKPGTTILFRTVILNSQLKPAAEARRIPFLIFVTDGEGNRVKEWKNLDAPKGVFTGELKLSERPVLGNWNLSVMLQGQIFSKSIEVAEYVLPKFIVKIDAPKHVTFREGKMLINIQTRYDYGKKVEGEATVTVYPTIYSGVIQPIFQNPVRKIIPIDGSAQVEFDIEGDLRLNDEYERTVIIDVRVEETGTGRRQNNSAEVHIHKYNYKMDLIKTADYFKPGLKYIAYVKITNHDGSPINPNRNELTVRHGYSREDEVYVETQYKINKNGIVKLEYITPSGVTNATALRIEAEYLDLKERISPIPAAVSFSNTFLQAVLETEKPVVNLDVEVSVNCTEPMRYLSYVLMARGDVLIANSFQVDLKREFQFHFTATHAMVPVAHLIVSYIRDDGELVGDSLDIEVDGLLQNFIDVQVNTVESEPNLDVDFTVVAQANSYIGLLAVDQNARTLRSGYDVTHVDVAGDLKKYDASIQSPYFAIKKDSKYHFFWKPGSSNPHSAIYDSGADLLTNSHVNRHKPTLEDIYLRPIFYGTSTVKPDRGFGIPIPSVTRPPLAGPYAFSRIPRPVWNRPKVYITEDIADTWLFNNFTLGYGGKTSIRRRLPSSLNTWVITGFSLDPLHGLGLISTPKKLKVSKNFIVTLSLPYSIKKGETLAVPVVVYNYLNQDQNVDITLHNQEQMFTFADTSDSNNQTRVELYRRKKIGVKQNSASAVSFMITPRRVGNIDIKVTASSPRNQDMIIKTLKVEHEGEIEYYTKTVLIDLRNSQTFKSTINITIPNNVVEGSQRIEVSAVGDLLGPTMANLEDIISLPTDCGEQNLVHFMPNLIILKYLRNTGQSTPTVENEAIGLLESTYQQQLSFKRNDGSFSVFGTRDNISSVWLTAYTVLNLKQAKEFIYVDERIIKDALEWLSNIQNRDGSFVETGSIVHSEVQNKDGTSLALTAFVVIAFIESQQGYASEYKNNIYKGLDYIARHIDESESTYSIALCSYALQLANHASKQSALNLLDARATSRKNMKWWRINTVELDERNPWNKLPNSLDIETTSYGLLALLEANLIEDAFPVLNWLVNQANSIGGFTSSQDSVIGLYAIFKLISRLSAPANIQIDYTYKKGESSKFTINQNIAMIVQKSEISKDSKQVNISAQGSGLALFRVSYQYNTNVTGPWPLFTLDPQVDKNSNQDHLQISICTSFVSRNLSEREMSNMAVMEVSLPSGFTADVDSLPSLEVSQNVQKVETKNELTKVILYFNNITRKAEYCPTVSAFRTHKVANQRPVSVVVFDYYDTSRRARLFYKGLPSALCDICEAEDCGNACASRPNKQTAEDKNKTNGENMAISYNANWLWLCFSILALYRM